MGTQLRYDTRESHDSALETSRDFTDTDYIFIALSIDHGHDIRYRIISRTIDRECPTDSDADTKCEEEDIAECDTREYRSL